MWIFTKHGFYSAVCARQGNGEHGQPVDANRIMVRARLRAHLEALQARFADLLGSCEIREFAGSDYAFRIFIPKSVWAQVVCALAEEIDYENFKSEAARHQGEAGIAYECSLHEVWTAMNKLQK